MVVVTGATGHIGGVLVRTLLARGERVRVIIPPGECAGPLETMNVERVIGDVRQPDSLRRAFEGAGVVYHLAAVISVAPGARKLVWQVNVEGVRNVVAACLAAGVTRLVHTSSIEALVPPTGSVVLDESVPFSPEVVPTAYGRSKAHGTLAVLDGIRRGLEAVIVCPTGVIGPHGQRAVYRTSPMGRLIRDVSRGKPIAYIDGAFDFVDVRDVADGIIAACDHGRAGECYILSGQMLSLIELIQLIQKTAGVKAPLLKVPMGLAQAWAGVGPLFSMVTRKTPRLTPDTIRIVRQGHPVSHEKASRELGYSPRPLDVTIRDTVNWLRNHEALPIATPARA